MRAAVYQSTGNLPGRSAIIRMAIEALAVQYDNTGERIAL